MKRNTIIAAGTALVLAVCLNNSQGQDPAPTPAPPATAPAPNLQPAPGPGPRPMPRRVRQPQVYVQRTLADLRMLKMTLKESQDDFGGHKEAALAACDKAAEELDALMKVMPKPVPPQRPGQQPRSTFQNNLTPLPPAGANPPPPGAAPVAPQP